DALAGNRVYLPAILAVNKCELMSPAARLALTAKLRPFEPLYVSARERIGLAEIIEGIGRALAFIRIYVKPPGRPPDREEPVILRRGDRVSALLNRLPGDLERSFKAAQVWGTSARFPGQTVGREHILADQDVVTIVIQRGA
ncbi:MAG TPA: TGS domain-containing protein, partial [Thermoplasmata archaeon]|nr:TGS domain-containing protein [Thermoplasmata archaeon]